MNSSIRVSTAAGLCLPVLFGFVFYLAAESIPAERPDSESIARGRELFNKKEGLKVKFECILCHKQDKAIKNSEVQKIGDHLPAVINKYLVEKSKGSPLPADGPEMQALMAYIRYEHSQ